MTVLVISYRPAQDIVCMGHVVDQSPAAVRARVFQTEEEAATAVAHLDGYNELDAAKYDHFFIYPDNECQEGEYKFSETDLDLTSDNGGIPRHLANLVASKTKEFREAAMGAKLRARANEDARREKEQHARDLLEYEHLRKKLGLDQEASCKS